MLIREAAPVSVQPASAAPQPEWRMGTVRSVDRAAAVVVLTDGTAVRIAPTAVVRRGNERVMLDQIVPGTEVVIRRVPPTYGGTRGRQRVPWNGTDHRCVRGQRRVDAGGRDEGEQRCSETIDSQSRGTSLVALVATGCGTATGAAVGAGAGAAVGAGTGYGAGKGALIGTGVGVAAGAIYDLTKHNR